MTLDAVPGSMTVGIDTHKDTHHAAVLGPAGQLIATSSFPTTGPGYAALLLWASGLGPIGKVGMEGTASYGAGLARYLTGHGMAVFEVPPGDKALRRLRGKTDASDAEAAARRVLADPQPAIPKTTDGTFAVLRQLYVARKLLVKMQTELSNQIGQLLITGPDDIRARYSTGTTLARMRQLVSTTPEITDPVERLMIDLLRDLATRWLDLRTRTRQLHDQIHELVTLHAPALLSRCGVGAITAAALLTAVGGNGNRIRSEAALAMLFGAAPIPVQSGTTNRHRISHGGNRDANCALHQIAIARLGHDPRSQTYRDTHLAHGKTKKDVIRLIKRALCRELFPLLCPH
ncbi:IS110 family transposase [Glaciibacter flavus]|uniref:IS110 family transposase n=2 Tax=Orlajensenia flava TaxID=2565934 RepID=A0A4V3WSI7_9MICO|nr:IS110 family transposase [Glaciibacter flavus]